MAALNDRDQFERRFGLQFGRVAARHRKELEQLLGNPPDPRNVPAEFWNRVKRESEEELAALLVLIFVASAQQHGLSLDGAQTAGAAWAGQRAAESATNWAEHGRERLQTATAEWQAKTERGESITTAEIRDRTSKVFGPDRVEAFATTETTAGERNGSDRAVEASGIVAVRRWRHGSHRPKGHSRASRDPCPICSPLENLTEPEWQRVHPGLDGPPAHPFCDCFVDYVDPKTLDRIDLGQARI